MVNARRLLEDSPVERRFDLKSELSTGLPYTLAHADQVGQALARLIQRPAPKKGLITDLDDTLWKGIVGDVDAEGVSWDLASHSQLHGLYQQLLRALAGFRRADRRGQQERSRGGGAGVCTAAICCCRKRAFFRSRCIGTPNRHRPENPEGVEYRGRQRGVRRRQPDGAGRSQGRVAGDGVSSVSRQAIPANAEQIFRKLRDLFGKSRVGAEDALRLESLRRSAEFRSEAEQSGGAPEAVFRAGRRDHDGRVQSSASDTRVLELVNKTNQFNLNGRRFTEADWRRQLEQPGPLSWRSPTKTSSDRWERSRCLCGRHRDGVVDLSAWVMSCRAFSRRIEDRCLEILFDQFGVEEIRFRFEPTPKNGPTCEVSSAIWIPNPRRFSHSPARVLPNVHRSFTTRLK